MIEKYLSIVTLQTQRSDQWLLLIYFFPVPQQLSKAALKNKKKREAAKKKREEDGKEETDKKSPGSIEKVIPSSAANIELTGDPEKDKKIRNLKKVIMRSL